MEQILEYAEKPIKQKRRWHQFSLRTLLIFVTVVAVACSWLTVKMEQAKKQRAEVERINNLSANIYYSFQCNGDGKPIEDAVILLPNGNTEVIECPESRIPSWLPDQFGVDFFYKVSSIRVYSDNDVEALGKTDIGKQLKYLIFHAKIEETRTDEKIEHRIHEILPNCRIEIERVMHIALINLR
jgi:hypothetical protein